MPYQATDVPLGAAVNGAVTGTGAAGSPASGVVSVQGVSGGTPIPIAGTFTPTNADSVSSISLAALNAVSSVTMAGYQGAGCTLTGTWVGTVLAEFSYDNTNWASTNLIPVSSPAVVASATANGTYAIFVPGGAGYVRVRCSAYTSGTVTGTLRATTSQLNGVDFVVAMVLPPGASTAANQATEIASLSTIATQTAGLATAAAQTTGNASLSSIASQTSGLATASAQTTGNASLATLATASASQATAANQATGNASLATLATASASQATAANQSTQNGYLNTLASASASQATAANQATGNASLATLATASASQATAANQATGNASLATLATASASQATASNQTSGNAVTQIVPAQGAYTHAQPTVANNTSTQLLAASSARKYVEIQNGTSGTIALNFAGATLTSIVPSASNPCITVPAGQEWVSPDTVVPTGAITAFQSTGASTNLIGVVTA